jgi:hypothetical protein
MSILSQPLAHIEVYFILDGKKYQVEDFHISATQDIDHKGQPQSEVNGGKLVIALPQMADNNLYMWAKKSTLLKNGQVLFQTDMGMTILEISFENAYCISLSRSVSNIMGASTRLLISPERISINGIEHENIWRKS